MGKSENSQENVLLPTPSAQMAGEKIVNILKTKDGEPAQLGERAYNPNTGKHVQMTLNRAVAMQLLPTPQTSDANMRQGVDTASHKRNLERGQLASVVLEARNMLPTPRAQDSYERSNWKTVVRANNGEAQMTLSRKIRYQSLLPTPTAMDTVDRDLEKQEKRHSFGVAETIKAVGVVADKKPLTATATSGDDSYDLWDVEKRFPVSVTKIQGEICLKSYNRDTQHEHMMKLCVCYLLSTNDWHSNKCTLVWVQGDKKSLGTTITKNQDCDGSLMDGEDLPAASFAQKKISASTQGCVADTNGTGVESYRVIYQLCPRNNSVEKHLLRTPDANMDRGSHTEEKLKERYFVKKQPLNLNDQFDMVQRGMLPTPRVCSAMSAVVTSESANDPKRFPNLETVVGKALLPTPRVSIAFADINNNRGKGNLEDKMAEALMPQISDDQNEEIVGQETLSDMVEEKVKSKTKAGLKLQPKFVEWMMGYPTDWTNLN